MCLLVDINNVLKKRNRKRNKKDVKVIMFLDVSFDDKKLHEFTRNSKLIYCVTKIDLIYNVGLNHINKPEIHLDLRSMLYHSQLFIKKRCNFTAISLNETL